MLTHTCATARGGLGALLATALLCAAAAAPPEGAVMLFDGERTNLFVSSNGGPIDWPVEDGALVSTPNSRRSNNLVSRLHFRDAEIHVEFMVPSTGDGNSGVYVHGLYELQVLNSHGKSHQTDGDMGAIYGLHKPLVNAARSPGEWQTLDVHYQTPRRNAEGKLIAEGTISAWLNGRKIHDRAPVGDKTSAFNPFVYDTTPYLRGIHERQKTSGTGPLILQDHDSPVRFRSIWIKPLDDHAFMYEPSSEPGDQGRSP